MSGTTLGCPGVVTGRLDVRMGTQTWVGGGHLLCRLGSLLTLSRRTKSPGVSKQGVTGRGRKTCGSVRGEGDDQGRVVVHLLDEFRDGKENKFFFIFHPYLFCCTGCGLTSKL